MLPTEFKLADEFPPASYEQWRVLAEADLGGAPFEQKLITHTYEGIDLRPIYTRRDVAQLAEPSGYPGLPPFTRGTQPHGASQTGWDLRQEFAHPDVQQTNHEILEDLQGGVTSLLLRLDSAARNGMDADDAAAKELVGRDGVMIHHVNDLDATLANVHLQMIGLTLEAGAAFLPASALVVALWNRRGIDLAEVCGAFNADPLAVLARDGQLPLPVQHSLEQLADLAVWTSQHAPHVTAVRVGTAPYHHAGATAVQDLALGMATGVTYLRAMTDRGLSIDAAARQIQFSISVGTHHFLAIAKLRAARRLWCRVVEACGGSTEAGRMRLHSRLSKRVLTYRDPHVNLLRNTFGVFAAGVAGADAITSIPFDAVVGLPDAQSRRIARNTLLVLQEESHLERVVDPAGGSWYLDWLTEQLATQAWAFFQQIERAGGMLVALESGWVAGQIESAFAPRAKNLARRKDGITGVSEFPNVAEAPVVRHPPDRSTLVRAAAERLRAGRREVWPTQATAVATAIAAASAGASIGHLARQLGFHQEPTVVAPISPHPFAEPFEELRASSDEWATSQGHHPRVFLANMGSPTHHTARATYAKNFFEAGGFEVISNNGFRDATAAAQAFASSGAHIAVICSSDKLYPEAVPVLAPQLKSAGATTVVLAGNPGVNEADWRAAGVDRFIFVKCDVLATLREMLRQEGVLLT